MWCHVSQPNNVVLEVSVDQKANGQECLEKVNFPFIVQMYYIIYYFAHIINI